MELKHFSVNMGFLATFCAVLIFASFYQEKEETIFAFSLSLRAFDESAAISPFLSRHPEPALKSFHYVFRISDFAFSFPDIHRIGVKKIAC